MVVVVLALVAAACSSESISTDPITAAPTTGESTMPASTSVSTTEPTATTPSTTEPTETTSSTTEPTEMVDVKVYFLLGERLVIDHRDVTPPAVLREAIEALLDGPGDPTHTTAIPPGTEVHGVNLVDGLATIDLSGDFETGGGSMMMLARIGQVVFTATQFDNVDSVRFWIDGVAIDFLGGEGIVMTDPWTRAMVPRDLTGSVLVDTPRPGETVTSPFTVTGEGDVFEGEFVIEIRRGSTVLVSVPMIRAGAWGDWDDFSTSIDVEASPGAIDLVAVDAGGCDPAECGPPAETIVSLMLAD